MSETTIPLSKLVPWSGNVRKTRASDGVAELAASIAAHGLLQSLVVRKAARGKYAVVAGRRRYLALAQLTQSRRVVRLGHGLPSSSGASIMVDWALWRWPPGPKRSWPRE